jgi:NADP-dependent 3-hydroxy acid dehydrogenase YdfG
LLLSALDRWSSSPRDAVRIGELKVVFRKPANVDTAIDFEIAGDDPIRLVARVGDARVMEATLRSRDVSGSPPATVATAPWPVVPVDVPSDALDEHRGTIAIAIDLDAATRMFPHAIARLGSLAVAELLATTRLVGMICPGLHSVYGGLALRARDADTHSLAYEVKRTVPKVSLVDIAVRGAMFEGNLETFSRPRPRPGPSLDELARVIEPGEFAGQRALVVGGSRGIGETIVRCLAFGGAEVCATYHRGADDAARIVAELAATTKPRAIVAAQLDVTRPIDLASVWRFDRAPTHLYYVATSRIPTGRFAPADLHELLRYDVDGLAATVAATFALTGDSLVVWTPSTATLDTGSGNAAFALSKAAMEELCRRLPGLARANIHVPRLPRVATDQSAALVELPARPVLDVVLPELRELTPLTAA